MKGIDEFEGFIETLNELLKSKFDKRENFKLPLTF